ncbi:MAG: hypothetical protein ABR577_11710 [Pyrinomonadaceae bacterium]
METEERQVELMSPQCFLAAIRETDVATLATVSAGALAMASGLD